MDYLKANSHNWYISTCYKILSIKMHFAIVALVYNLDVTELFEFNEQYETICWGLLYVICVINNKINSVSSAIYRINKKINSVSCAIYSKLDFLPRNMRLSLSLKHDFKEYGINFKECYDSSIIYHRIGNSIISESYDFEEAMYLQFDILYDYIMNYSAGFPMLEVSQVLNHNMILNLCSIFNFNGFLNLIPILNS